jgi:hypothetical protein
LLSSGDLSRFDTIVVGVRASEARPDFVANNGRLRDYMERGGTLIVQYQQTDYITRGLPPYPVKVEGNPRVTDETAAVKILVPRHPVFSFPNTITDADFQGWVQERNLYSFGTFDGKYTALLEASDPEEKPQTAARCTPTSARGATSIRRTRGSASCRPAFRAPTACSPTSSVCRRRCIDAPGRPRAAPTTDMRTFLWIVLAVAAAACGSGPEKPPMTENAPSDRDIHSYARPWQARVTHVALDLTADFAAKTLAGSATLNVDRAAGAKQIVLDTKGLAVERVTDKDGTPLTFTLGNADAILGRPLTVDLPASGPITIAYRTSPDAAALQWLAPSQTAGKSHPYLYSQGQAILTARGFRLRTAPASGRRMRRASRCRATCAR